MANYQKEFYSLSETSRILGKTRVTIKRWLDKGILKGKKGQRDWLIHKSEIDKFKVE